ncbi:MAG: AfsR/SARP family transcriptional regulator [Kutzneria sp.]|nr:AfsR/SARP family transcriptional regulator [Kutzneria sp.]
MDLAPSAPRLRAVLSLLALNGNRVVTPSMFLREISPPIGSRNTLQTYIFHLRKLFEKSLERSSEYVAREVLLTHADGYLLCTDSFEFDISEFEQLVEAGNAALDDRDFVGAVPLLNNALALWRGPITEAWSLGTQAHAHATRFEELRFRALIACIEANLCLGRHHEMVSELASLVVEYPLQQTVHAMFMLALHRSERTSGALAVFRRLSARMREELGIEPSPRLQALHQALLAPDPVLTVHHRRLEELFGAITVA